MRSCERRQKVQTQSFRYYMLNKPAGVVSACRDAEHKTVLELLPEELRGGLFPIGRLDKNTEGLLLLTDDGKLNRALLAPEKHVEKEYFVWVTGAFSAEIALQMEHGVAVKGMYVPLSAKHVQFLGCTFAKKIDAVIFENRRAILNEEPATLVSCVRMVLTEGKRHQIKRMMEAVGCTVVALRRVAFGGLELDSALSPGTYRLLRSEEVEQLQRHAGML